MAAPSHPLHAPGPPSTLAAMLPTPENTMIRILLLSAWLAIALSACIVAHAAEPVVPAIGADPRPAEVTALTGAPLSAPEPLPNAGKLEADLAAAREAWRQRPDDPEALIWVGRRLGYLWRYRESIDAFTQGIARWPDDARFYRHRGHRYITMRDFPHAQADLENAARLIAGRVDEIEPDGMPNRANQPRTTLAYNTWYHLGLAHYLQGDYEGALAAYRELLKTSAADNNDSIVAVSDWMWMSLMRLGRKDEAKALLGRITPDMPLLENDSYHLRLLMYKGLESPDSLLDPATADGTDLATQGYGVANYYLVTGQPDKAKAVLERIVAGTAWNAFGYIAAEADLSRMD